MMVCCVDCPQNDRVRVRVVMDVVLIVLRMIGLG